ncbi:MAG: hypothetical protein P0S96_07010 [Simkaniaceae bacterium]|nr:hypothetical protein [Candidatus Sacchlamyda saccharinae]
MAEMVLRDRDLIRYMRPDTDAMANNLRAIRAKVLRNTNPEEAKRIKAGFNKAIAEIMKVGVHVKRDRNNSWTAWVWNKTAVPMGNLAYKTGSLAYRLTLAGIKAPFKLAWSAVK